MNYLANALPLNNKTTGELSDSFPNLFVPAGITFSIWGVIYILLLIFTVFQFTARGKEASAETGWLFAISCILNALWIVFWHYGKLPLSLLVMAGLLITLILINIAIRPVQQVILKASFGIYLGWICIAAIANVTALLVSYGWNGFNVSQEAWAIIMILAGTLIVSFTLLQLRNPFIGIAVAWAFIGIAIKRQDDYRSIFITALIALVLVAIVTIWAFFRKVPDGI
ncbi:MAG: TspO/MBR family protein [Methanosarcina sp.]|nr:TspO/MBR family protein [Methanosarcina sp.]